MESSTSDLSQFSGFSESDIPLEYQDSDNGGLYSVVETCLGESITISFFNRQDFDKLLNRLESKYVFHQNQDMTGQIATISYNNTKVVVTAYKSCKLLVQGNASRSWFNTVFKQLVGNLNTDCSTTASNQTRQGTQTSPKIKVPLPKSKSTGVLASISKAIFGPSVIDEYAKLGFQLKKALKAEKKGKLEIDYEELRDQVLSIQKTGVKPKQKLHKLGRVTRKCAPLNYKRTTQTTYTEEQTDTEETHVKTLHHMENAADSTSLCSDLVLQYVEEQQQRISDTETDCSLNTHPIESEPQLHSPHDCKAEDTLHQAQTDILHQKIKSLTHTNETLILTNKRQERDLAKMMIGKDTKISDLMAKTLILEEENKKLKSDIKIITSENRKHQAKISQQSCASENSEEILSQVSTISADISAVRSILGDLQESAGKSATGADIRLMQADLKTTFKQEISCSKPNESQECFKRQPAINESKTQRSSKSDPIARPRGAPSEASNIKTNNSKKIVYIIGDSVTKVLNPRRLSGENYRTFVKTNYNACIQDIKSKVVSDPDKNLDACDAIVLHAGFKDVLEAKCPSDIIQDYKNLVQSARNKNKTAEIIISAVLPKQCSPSVAEEVNSQLREMCAAGHRLHFMDIQAEFIRNNQVDGTLFVDETTLSSKGTGRFARCIKDAVNSALKLRDNKRIPQAQGFHRRPMRGPRYRQPQMTVPPWMMMPHYWNPYAQHY